MGFFVIKVTFVNEVAFMNIIIEKDAAAYIKKHSKDNSVLLYIHTSSAG